MVLHYKQHCWFIPVLTNCTCRYAIIVLVKGKAIPLQAWTGPDGSRRMRFPDFKTIGT